MNEHNISNFWQVLSTTSIGIIITLLGFWVGIGRKIVSKEEISEMIKHESPYNVDRQFIMERLASNKETQLLLTAMLQRNTEVMTELKIQIATLGKTLEALEERIERN
jgi:predicted RND superfamily exporter protein